MLAGIVYGNGRAGVYHGRVHSQCTQILLMHRECWFHVVLLARAAVPVGHFCLIFVPLIITWSRPLRPLVLTLEHNALCLLLEADPVGMSILNRGTLSSLQHAFKR